MRQNPDQQTTSERDALGQYLDYQRETILLKTEGLTREQLGQQIPTSGLTLAGILYHLALNEEAWFEVDFLGLPEREEWRGIDWEADPDYEFRTALTKEPDWLRHRYRDACDRARQAAASADTLDQLSVSTRIDGSHSPCAGCCCTSSRRPRGMPGRPICFARPLTAPSANSGDGHCGRYQSDTTVDISGRLFAKPPLLPPFSQPILDMRRHAGAYDRPHVADG